MVSIDGKQKKLTNIFDIFLKAYLENDKTNWLIHLVKLWKQTGLSIILYKAIMLYDDIVFLYQEQFSLPAFYGTSTIWNTNLWEQKNRKKNPKISNSSTDFQHIFVRPEIPKKNTKIWANISINFVVFESY